MWNEVERSELGGLGACPIKKKEIGLIDKKVGGIPHADTWLDLLLA